MSLYPALDEVKEELNTVDGYRLHQISEIKHQLEKERDARICLYKKYRRAVNILDGLDASLVVASMGLGIAGVGLLSTIIAAPVVLTMEGAALACGLGGIASKFIAKKLHKKVSKHDSIRVLAESKLNTIEDHISTALSDSKISDEEFRLILSELEKYNKMKRYIQNISHKVSGITEEEKKEFIRLGKKQAQEAFQAKAMALIKSGD